MSELALACSDVPACPSPFKPFPRVQASARGLQRDVRAVVKTLRGVEVLQVLSGSQLTQLAEAMEQVGGEVGRGGEGGVALVLFPAVRDGMVRAA